MNWLGALAAFRNIQFTNSVVAGGAASMLIYAAGSMLVSFNVIIPGLNEPVTMGMVGAVAVPLGQLVTAMVPDSIKQHINALAVKLPKLQAMVPTTYSAPSDFPNAPPSALVASVENPPATKADAAIAVIAIKAEMPTKSDYPTGKNGA